MVASFITVTLPDSGTVNWILILILSIRLGFDLVTILSPVALRYLGAWCIARAASIDAQALVMSQVKSEERLRLKLPVNSKSQSSEVHLSESSLPESALLTFHSILDVDKESVI